MNAGIPVVSPFGGHAIFVDAKALLPHIKPLAYPGQALVAELYLEGRIRSVELLSVMRGRQSDGSEKEASMELVRLAIPRRVYTRIHLAYVADVMKNLGDRRDRVRGLKIMWEPPSLRHFTARFLPTS